MGVLGDSKSTTANPWGTSLITALNNDGTEYFYENVSALGRDWSVGGYTVANAKDSIDAWLTRRSVSAETQYIFLINLGTNEIYTTMPDSTAWATNYLYIIDAIQAKYENSKIYLTYPWQRNGTDDANTIAGWIDSIIAERSRIYSGDDERIWLENGDNGATMTYDGTHYTTAGNNAKVAAVRAVLGF